MVHSAQQQASTSKRMMRYFSEAFRRKKVAELDKRLTTISELCRQYQVSRTSVYKWIYNYSLMRSKGEKLVVEAKSDTQRIKALSEHIRELEQLVGQKQFRIEFLERQLQIASERYGADLKKKPSMKPSCGTGNTEGNTPTK